ncbi:MAG: divalent metal cation transporter [Burkholderiaceae bacterium]
MVLAAGAFHRPGQAPITELADAYKLLSPLLGVGIASAVFGIAWLASGLSSSVTGTLAGQMVMEGFFLHLQECAHAGRTIKKAPRCRAFAWRENRVSE